MMMPCGWGAASGMMVHVNRAVIMHVHRHGRDDIDIETGRGTGPQRQGCPRCEHAGEIAERNQPPGPGPNTSRHAQKHVARLGSTLS